MKRRGFLQGTLSSIAAAVVGKEAVSAPVAKPAVVVFYDDGRRFETKTPSYDLYDEEWACAFSATGIQRT